MFLAIDIGNTQTTFGLFNNDGSIQYKEFIQSSSVISAYSPNEVLIHSGPKLRSIGIASVVPSLTHAFIDVLTIKFPQAEIKEVGHTLNPGFKFCVDDPSEVGADRIANCAYAVQYFAKVGMTRRPLLIIDMGTAITFDCVSSQREYLGGLIYPGVDTAFQTLFEKAARLKSVQLKKPRHLIGKNTVEHLQSGFYYGTKSLIHGLIQEYKKEIPDLFVIATGGHSHQLLNDKSFPVDVIDPDLTLKGIYSLCYNET